MECARRGARAVVLVARTSSKLSNVRAEIEGIYPGTRVLTVAVDCSNGASVQKELRAMIASELGGRVPDVLVNNAGAGKWRYLHESEPEDIDGCLVAPLAAALHVSSVLLPMMLKDTARKFAIAQVIALYFHTDLVWFGVLMFSVQVQSPAGVSAWPGATAYIAARWGLHGLSVALAADYHGRNLCVREVFLGEVTSNYFSSNEGSHERLPKIASVLPVMTPARAAKHILDSIEGAAPITAGPWQLGVLLFLSEHFSHFKWTVLWLNRVLGHSF